MYAIRSWFLVWFVTTHTETKMKWHRHSAVCNSKWKAKLLKHSNSDPDAVHNNVHPALGSQTRIDPSAAIPRTVAVQDVEPFCALSFGSVATQSVPETSAFSNGPNLNFWRSSHSPQVAAHLPPCLSDSPAPSRPCWTRNTTSHVQFREELTLLWWLLWSLGVNQLVTRRARLTQEFGRVARRTNCSGRTCFASFTPAMCPASTQVAWRRAEATTHGLSLIGCDCVCLTSSRNHQSLTPSELQRNFPRVSPQKASSSILPYQPVVCGERHGKGKSSP